MSEKKKGFQLRAKKPGTVQLNRKVIVAIVAVAAVVLVMIVLMSLTSQPAQQQQDTSIHSHRSLQKADTNPIDNLPGSYADAAKINALLKRNQQPKEVIPSSVSQELESLRAQQAQLQSQLASLRNKPQQHYTPPPQPKVVSPMEREAMTSAIFFSGGAPAPMPKTQNAALDKNNKKATATDKGKGAGKESGYDQQNQQNQKMNFLSGKPDKSIYNENTVQYPVSKYIVQAGTVIRAILENKIVSNLPGNIVAVVSQNVYDSINGNYLIIPKGSKLLGEYNSKISYGQYELQAKFTRLIRPDGTSIVLPNQQGINSMGVSGFSDTVDNHWGQILSAAVIATLFNIPAVVATNQMNNQYSYNTSTPGVINYNKPSLGSTAGASVWQSVGQTASQVGGKLAERSLNIQPTITIHSGYQFSVMVTKDMVLPPYHTPYENIPEVNQ